MDARPQDTDGFPPGHTAARRSFDRARQAALAAVTAFTLSMLGMQAAVAAAEPVQVGPTVTVTASKSGEQTPAQTAYVATMYKKLQRASRYPTGREASLARPSGTATVWVDVAADGRVKGRGLEKSSGSPILDRMADSLVGRTRFAALPAGDWGDGSLHRFNVSYQFDGAAMTAGRASSKASASP